MRIILLATGLFLSSCSPSLMVKSADPFGNDPVRIQLDRNCKGTRPTPGMDPCPEPGAVAGPHWSF